MPTGQYQRKRTSISEFFQKYTKPDQSGCILWIGSLDEYGYGRIYDANTRRHVKASRYSLEKKLGRPIRNGMLACHTCDVPACVNEDHLYEGTHKENSDDKYARSDGNRGERQGKNKLTSHQAEAIRNDKRKGVVIANEYGVSQMTVSQIRRGITWRNI